MKKLFVNFTLVLLFIFTVSVDLYADDTPEISYNDRIRIAEAFRLSELYGEQIWEGWNDIQFATLLVTPEYEFLIRHPKPSQDFVLIGYDSLLGSEVYYRARVFDTRFLATFPAVGGINTVVVGQPEKTGKTGQEWIITLLHEHFHQLQTSEENYGRDIEALNLASGEGGMWMLDYPFPYKDEEINKQFKVMGNSLYKAVMSKERRDYDDFMKERKKFTDMLDEDDYKYFSFQVWQEGIARYTELVLAELIGESYKPTPELESMEGYLPFKEVYERILSKELSMLEDISLKDLKRIAYYPVGAAEGLLMDYFNPGWREKYFPEKFYIEYYR